VRLFAVAALVIVVALGAVALLTHVFVRREFRRFEVTEHAARVEGAAEVLAGRLARERDPARLDPLLAELGHSVGRDLILIDPGGRVLGASTLELRRAQFALEPGGRMVIEGQLRRGGMVGRARMILERPPGAEVKRADGSLLGRLVLLPPSPEGNGASRAPFGGAFYVRLVLAALAAGVVALAFTWMLSRRILKPVGALTDAARRLGRGDLASRVDEDGKRETQHLDVLANQRRLFAHVHCDDRELLCPKVAVEVFE